MTPSGGIHAILGEWFAHRQTRPRPRCPPGRLCRGESGPPTTCLRQNWGSACQCTKRGCPAWESSTTTASRDGETGASWRSLLQYVVVSRPAMAPDDPSVQRVLRKARLRPPVRRCDGPSHLLLEEQAAMGGVSTCQGTPIWRNKESRKSNHLRIGGGCDGRVRRGETPIGSVEDSEPSAELLVMFALVPPLTADLGGEVLLPSVRRNERTWFTRSNRMLHSDASGPCCIMPTSSTNPLQRQGVTPYTVSTEPVILCDDTEISSDLVDDTPSGPDSMRHPDLRGQLQRDILSARTGFNETAWVGKAVVSVNLAPEPRLKPTSVRLGPDSVGQDIGPDSVGQDSRGDNNNQGLRAASDDNFT